MPLLSCIRGPRGALWAYPRAQKTANKPLIPKEADFREKELLSFASSALTKSATPEKALILAAC